MSIPAKRVTGMSFSWWPKAGFRVPTLSMRGRRRARSGYRSGYWNDGGGRLPGYRAHGLTPPNGDPPPTIGSRRWTGWRLAGELGGGERPQLVLQILHVPGIAGELPHLLDHGQ